MIKLFKKIILIVMLFIMYFFICAFSYSKAVSADIANSVFRLHVIANSNSVDDQNLKYLVRDELLKYMNEISKDATSKEEAIQLAKDNLNSFYTIAQKIISENGYDYSVKIYIGKSDFPTKYYGDIALPAGNYDSLKVEIGSAKGENWWCVMFPPLCFVDVTSGIVPQESKELIKDNLSSEEYMVISNNNKNNTVQFKFKVLELFQSIKLANK